MKNITCIEDLREIARRKVPRAFFDYMEAGSYSQQTLRANPEDLAIAPSRAWASFFLKLVSARFRA